LIVTVSSLSLMLMISIAPSGQSIASVSADGVMVISTSSAFTHVGGAGLAVGPVGPGVGDRVSQTGVHGNSKK
jgi:hypothetical protein